MFDRSCSVWLHPEKLLKLKQHSLFPHLRQHHQNHSCSVLSHQGHRTNRKRWHQWTDSKIFCYKVIHFTTAALHLHMLWHVGVLSRTPRSLCQRSRCRRSDCFVFDGAVGHVDRRRPTDGQIFVWCRQTFPRQFPAGFQRALLPGLWMHHCKNKTASVTFKKTSERSFKEFQYFWSELKWKQYKRNDWFLQQKNEVKQNKDDKCTIWHR